LNSAPHNGEAVDALTFRGQHLWNTVNTKLESTNLIHCWHITQFHTKSVKQ
jgi:hypothetical protein